MKLVTTFSLFFVSLFSISSGQSTTPLVTKDCNSCSPSSLKLVPRNNTPAPVIMGNYHVDGCLITVVACDIPECSDAVLDSYRPNGTFKRVTNEEGTVWPHLEMKCTPEGEYMWDGEIQTEFSCYSDDCVIPSTTTTTESSSSESSSSSSSGSSWSTTAFTVTVNGTETTVTPFTGSTDLSTTTFVSSTTPEKCSLCLDVETIFINENIKFEKPEITPRPADPSSTDCSFFSISCKSPEGQRCEKIELYNGFTIIAEDNFQINYNISCPGDKFNHVDVGTGAVTELSTLMCKYRNCEDYTSTTGISMESTLSTIASTINGTETTIPSFTDLTTSIASTTTEGCTAKCDDIESIMIKDDVRFARPLLLKRDPDEGYDECEYFNVVCKADDGQRCDSIILYNDFYPQKTDNFLVKLDISCNGGFHRYDEFGDMEIINGKFMCKYTNCVDFIPSSTTSETTVVPTTTIPRSCATCDIQSLFKYSDPTDKFQPWYYDIATTDCTCKAHDISCELYDVDICDSHKLLYLGDDNQEYTLAESTTNKVNGELNCQGNGKYQVNGINVKELYCISTNCRKS